MPKLEDVIKGLECHKRAMYGEIDEHGIACNLCPYKDMETTCHSRTEGDLIADALALLKEQIPRVMALEEVREIYSSNKAHIWPYYTPPYLWMENANKRNIVSYWISWSQVVGCIEGQYPRYDPDDYGAEWRLWTSRPTDEQMEAVKWDDND